MRTNQQTLLTETYADMYIQTAHMFAGLVSVTRVVEGWVH